MAYILEVKNPFEPLTSLKKYLHPGGITVLDWLRLKYPDPNNPQGFREFIHPTILIINGKPICRKDNGWRVVIRANDVVNFVTIPRGPFLVIPLLIVVVAVLVSLVFTALLPKTPGALPGSSPVFSAGGQTNTIRLGEPIECCYGRNRVFLTYASRPFFRYIGNQQYSYNLFCLGQGEYEIDQIQIGDTNIEDFDEAEYEVCPPGVAVTLFPVSVYTAPEAGGQTLFASDQAEYPVGGGWVGPFPTNPPGTQTTRLEIDIVLPKGLYYVNKKGKLETLVLGFNWEAREIDDDGDPIGSWFDLFSPPLKVIQLATTTPQRKSYFKIVPAGRYESRLRRTNTYDPRPNAGNEAVWEGLRAFLTEVPDFGNKTMIAIKIRATNNLNERTQIRFNAVATRKLPIWGSGGWSDPVPTRSIVWAFVDVFRAQYGGKITNDNLFDLEHFVELDDFYSSRNEHFDWIFRDAITVWEAAQTIARVGRAVALLAGSIITMRRDEPSEIPVTLFNQENILSDTFTYKIKLWDPDEYDSISAEYTEPDTGYKQEHVLCVLPGSPGTNPRDVRFVGIQDRNHAYHEGLYLAASQRYLRENIEFETGLEGHLPTFGDLIAICHDVPDWGKGAGFVVAAEENTGNTKLLLSQPVVWGDTGDHAIWLRSRTGGLLGPFTASPTTDDRQVYIENLAPIDFMFGGKNEPMLFAFGPVGNITKYAKVVKIEPMGEERVRITAVTYNSAIHSFDELTGPPIDIPVFPPETPDLPVITNLYVTQIDAAQHIIQIAWTPAFGAEHYVIEISYDDGESWSDLGTTKATSFVVQVLPGPVKVRVAGVNVGQGPWITEDFTVAVLGPISLDIPWDDTEWQVSWSAVPNAESYTVEIWDNTDPMSPTLEKTIDGITGLSYFYDYTAALADGLDGIRELLIKVDAVFSDGPTGEPSELEISNTIPEPPTSPAATYLSDDGSEALYEFEWDAPTEEDVITVKLWLSDNAGDLNPPIGTPAFEYTHFTPGSAGIPLTTTLPISLTAGAHPDMYWQVAFFDVWGNEISTNVTGIATIPAFP